jgi:hypothetical protein
VEFFLRPSLEYVAYLDFLHHPPTHTTPSRLWDSLHLRLCPTFALYTTLPLGWARLHRISQESRIRARASFLPCLCLSYTPLDHRPKGLVGRCPIHLSTCRLFVPTPTSRPRWTSHRECLASTCSTSKVSGQWLRRAGPDSLFFSPDEGRPHTDPTLSLLCVVVVGGVVSQGGKQACHPSASWVGEPLRNLSTTWTLLLRLFLLGDRILAPLPVDLQDAFLPIIRHAVVGLRAVTLGCHAASSPCPPGLVSLTLPTPPPSDWKMSD